MTEHKLYRYSTKDGGHVYTRGKTDALRECRKHAKLTPSDVTLDVEVVTTRDMTTKTILLALLNGEGVFVENPYDDTILAVSIAEVKGRLKPTKPEPLVIEPAPAEGDAPARPRKVSEWLERGDPDDEEYVTVYTKSGFRLMKLRALRPGAKVLTNKRVTTW